MTPNNQSLELDQILVSYLSSYCMFLLCKGEFEGEPAEMAGQLCVEPVTAGRRLLLTGGLLVLLASLNLKYTPFTVHFTLV